MTIQHCLHGISIISVMEKMFIFAVRNTLQISEKKNNSQLFTI